jgi:hypothetical protein
MNKSQRGAQMIHYIRLSFILISIIFSQHSFSSGFPDPEQENPPQNVVTRGPTAPNGEYVAIPMNNIPAAQPVQVREQDLLQRSLETARESRAKWLLIPAVGGLALLFGVIIWGVVEDVSASAASNHTLSCTTFLGSVFCG